MKYYRYCEVFALMRLVIDMRKRNRKVKIANINLCEGFDHKLRVAEKFDTNTTLCMCNDKNSIVKGAKVEARGDWKHQILKDRGVTRKIINFL